MRLFSFPMKISVRYGLYTSAAVVGWMLLGYVFELDKLLGGKAGLFGLLFYAVGIFFSVRHTRDRESVPPHDPRFLLKAGLVSSAIVSLAYCLFIFVMFEIVGKVDAPIGTKIMNLLILFIMNLLAGGLFSVMLAFLYARR